MTNPVYDTNNDGVFTPIVLTQPMWTPAGRAARQPGRHGVLLPVVPCSYQKCEALTHAQHSFDKLSRQVVLKPAQHTPRGRQRAGRLPDGPDPARRTSRSARTTSRCRGRTSGRPRRTTPATATPLTTPGRTEARSYIVQTATRPELQRRDRDAPRSTRRRSRPSTRPTPRDRSTGGSGRWTGRRTRWRGATPASSSRSRPCRCWSPRTVPRWSAATCSSSGSRCRSPRSTASRSTATTTPTRTRSTRPSSRRPCGSRAVSVTDLLAQLPPMPNGDDPYVWRIRRIDAAGRTGAWSDWGQFRVVEPSGDPDLARRRRPGRALRRPVHLAGRAPAPRATASSGGWSATPPPSSRSRPGRRPGRRSSPSPVAAGSGGSPRSTRPATASRPPPGDRSRWRTGHRDHRRGDRRLRPGRHAAHGHHAARVELRRRGHHDLPVAPQRRRRSAAPTGHDLHGHQCRHRHRASRSRPPAPARATSPARRPATRSRGLAGRGTHRGDRRVDQRHRQGRDEPDPAPRRPGTTTSRPRPTSGSATAPTSPARPRRRTPWSRPTWATPLTVKATGTRTGYDPGSSTSLPITGVLGDAPNATTGRVDHRRQQQGRHPLDADRADLDDDRRGDDLPVVPRRDCDRWGHDHHLQARRRRRRRLDHGPGDRDQARATSPGRRPATSWWSHRSTR